MSARSDGAALPFQVRRFSDMAVELLRERILSGALEPGQHLNEVALAEEMSISRPPLREAFRVLHGEGLVTMRPGRGVYVMTFDIESVLQLGDLRMALETESARLASVRAQPEDRVQLAAVLSQIEVELDQPDKPYPHHIDFHGALAAACHNPRLAQHAGDVRRQLKLATVRSGNHPARAQAALLEHRAVCDAVVHGDLERAEAAMRSHIEASIDAVVAMLGGRTKEELA